MIRVFQIRLESDNCFGRQVVDLPFQKAGVAPFLLQLLIDASQQLFAGVGVNVCEVAISQNKFVTLLV